MVFRIIVPLLLGLHVSVFPFSYRLSHFLKSPKMEPGEHSLVPPVSRASRRGSRHCRFLSVLDVSQPVWLRSQLWFRKHCGERSGWRHLLACVLPLLVLGLGSNHLYLFIYFCPVWVPVSDGHSCQCGKMQLSLQGPEFCKLVSLVQAHRVQLWIHTRPPFSSLSSCCDCICISGPLALWVYPKSRLGHLWVCYEVVSPQVILPSWLFLSGVLGPRGPQKSLRHSFILTTSH